jgi:hypothetical protein
MPFEETDKKIIEAAENHHPSYDEKAWEKMNKLLDKHMPVKEKRKRRAALLLFLFLLGGGGAAYFLLNDDAGKKFVSASTEQTASQQPATKNSTHTPNENIESIKPTGTELSENEKTSNAVKATPVIFSPAAKTPTENKTKKDQLAASPVKKAKDKDLRTDFPVTQNPALPVTQNSIFNPDPSINKSDDPSSANPETPSKNKSDVVSIQKDVIADAVKPQTTEETKAVTQETAVAKKSSKSKNGKGNGLFISASVGPDVGTVGTSSAGKLKTTYGFGLGYAFNERISLQTGFYVARKIYTAAPEDYNAPEWWWAYYPTLEKVDADCKVYEIPLLVNYNFSTNKKRNWFGTFGFSSYIMKKEDYNYHYKTSTGQPATRNWVYNNENKHYFSVITLAGGYERKISNKFSVSVSPYLKLPWQGVGFGKVKLNSTGALFSASFKPFAK